MSVVYAKFALQGLNKYLFEPNTKQVKSSEITRCLKMHKFNSGLGLVVNLVGSG